MISSDIFLLQEVTPENLSVVRSALPHHLDLEMSGKFFSILSEGNIMWHRSYFELVDSGFEGLEMADNSKRGLLWVRLRVLGTSKQLFVCTIHLPWCGSEIELSSGVNPRIIAAEKVSDIVGRLLRPDDVLIIGGDFNEDFHPLRIFKDRLHARDVFDQLDISPPVTHPNRPSDPREEMRVYF